MHRNEHGVNLDLGLPLQTEADFRLLHVCVAPDELSSFTEWILSGEGPLLLGGQIGVGKSTFIQAGYRAVDRRPLVKVHFDTDASAQTAAGYWAAIVRAFVRAALDAGLPLPAPDLPRELAGLADADWAGLVDVLDAKQRSLAAYRRQREIGEALADAAGYVCDFVRTLAQDLGCGRGESPGVFAGGVDKIGVGTASFFELRDCLRLLCEFKTLFEVNAVHLFGGTFSGDLRPLDQICLPAMAPESVLAVLRKRLGRYAGPPEAEGVLKMLAQFSGGNPRQGIRLLEAFEVARTAGADVAGAASRAIRTTIRDLFAFALAPKEELLRVVQRDRRIEAGMISVPGDPETAQIALFHNWILLQGQPESGTTWPAQVNPLLAFGTQSRPAPPEDPVAGLLRRYAEQEGMSAQGLELDPESAGQASAGVERLVETELPCNVRELMDSVGAMLLGQDRTEHVILAYGDAEAANVVRAYLFARANAYTLRRCAHIKVGESSGDTPGEKLTMALATESDILSIDVDVLLDDSAVRYLEAHRDELASRRVLWWIPREALKRYLRGWPQFRQFAKVLVLDDDVFATLDRDEVESDIAFLDLLTEDHAKAGADQLRTVLTYLRRRRGA